MPSCRRVAFDTNSLARLSTPDVTRVAFENALEHHDCRPAHALSTTQSLFGKPELVRKQFAALGALGFGKYPVLLFHRSILAAERADEHIGGPWFYDWDLVDVFGNVNNEAEFLKYVQDRQKLLRPIMGPTPAEHGEGLLEWWNGLSDSERNARKVLFGASEIPESIVGSSGVITRYVVERGVRDGYADAAFSDVQNHRASLALAGLLSLYLLGQLMHREHTPGFPWLKAERDDRNDVNIVAGVAYCEMFVTDDRNLRERLLFLRDRGCIFFEPLSTVEFLDE